MTIDHRAVHRMLLLETAAERAWSALHAREQRAYVLANPTTSLALLPAPAVGERATLQEGIGTGLRRVARSLQCDPMHARFLHELYMLLDAERGAVEAHPVHARAIFAKLKSARAKIPDSGKPLSPHDVHGDVAGTLLSASRDALGAAASQPHAERADLVKSAADMLRMANHLQKGNARSAHAHAMALPAIERETIPADALRHVRRHAGGKSARDPVGTAARVVKEHYRDASTNGRDAMRMNASISGRGTN